MATTKPTLPPRLSLKERDRRYKLIRKQMAVEGLDVLICPGNHRRWSQMMADSVYVTTIGGFSTENLVIFPLKGQVTSFVFTYADFWKESQNWVKDVRGGGNKWSDNAIQRLNELGIKKGRIGLSGLSGYVRAPDGIFPYTMVERLKAAFPNCEFVDATEIIMNIRSVKSAEEIEMMRHSMSIIEKIISVMSVEARPGVTERHLFAEMVRTSLDQGCEFPSLMNFASGPNCSGARGFPIDRILEKGDYIINEIEARYGGYSPQGVQPIVLGKPPKAQADLFDASHECFHALLNKMKPGVSVAELQKTYQSTVQKIGKGKYTMAWPMMHARGLGDEVPTAIFAADANRFKDVKLKTGMLFILKPGVGLARGNFSARLGDGVLVTRNGAERLGKRDMTLRVIN